MGKGLSTRPGDEDLAFRYFESFSPLPGERCREAWEALPEQEKVGWFRRAQRAHRAGGSRGEAMRSWSGGGASGNAGGGRDATDDTQR